MTSLNGLFFNLEVSHRFTNCSEQKCVTLLAHLPHIEVFISMQHYMVNAILEFVSTVTPVCELILNSNQHKLKFGGLCLLGLTQ